MANFSGKKELFDLRFPENLSLNPKKFSYVIVVA